MISWDRLPRAALDLETTGRDPRHARIVTASIVVSNSAGVVIGRHEWLADPGIEIPERAAAIHGVTTEMARAQGRPARQVVAEVLASTRELIDARIPLVIFNAPYDLTVLAAEAARWSLPADLAPLVIDPLVMDREVVPKRRGKGARTLVALCEVWGIDLLHAHTSAADALAALRLAEAMAAHWPALQMPARWLHQLQSGWAPAQDRDFRAYLQRKGVLIAEPESSWPR